MSQPANRGEDELHPEAAERLPDTPCGLAALRRRSQIDFEIDFFDRILDRDPNYLEVLENLGDLFSRKHWHRRALQMDQRLSHLKPHDPDVAYNLACSYSVLHQPSEAFDALERAIINGFRDMDCLRRDPDLAHIRSHPHFPDMLIQLQKTVHRG